MKKLSLLGLLAAATVGAQEKNTEHTMKLSPGRTAPAATANDMSWMTGRWLGEGTGGQSEPPIPVRAHGAFNNACSRHGSSTGMT